ncbi:NAD(P)/FAD-dependent oxidoreductase [Streptomyces griseiscabiei]|uniref:FAD-dependent oxidoreductase n=1 Tax=Streptomyces griseiscabiei TaxID=2993540 RepID=A0ABU4LBJ1_9ACTN|nr:FAD-dependent oxidoreductase [Streptomyces griseiscabiei]MBZ3900104.1 FAD-dependent oxidoreductase [Streptomyces griseiscabiei]MDX2913109.1 FAD-dependent oxidoreductase [Streptomyces griseiscabiei]
MNRRSVAVVGSGVAGLTAAHILSRSDDVVLYEADSRPGGHAHTHELPNGAGGTVRVDTGFIVHNERTYPHLLRLFRELGVVTQDAEMSMSVRCDGCGLEYAGARGPRGLLGGGNVLRGRHLRMLADVPRFHRAARRLLASGDDTQTFGSFLNDRNGFSPYFVGHFALPLVSAVWSCAPDTSLRYPAAYLFRFLDHHGLLSTTGSPQWKTVAGGSSAYVEKAVKGLASVRIATPVRAIERGHDHARVTTEDGKSERYAAVVVAVHPDQALRMLVDATPDERRVLGAFIYSRNPTVLHRDTGVLPRSPHARASWNYWLPSCTARPGSVRVSYDMNRLQRLALTEPHIVTLNPEDRVDESTVLARMVYEHPVYTPRSVAAQRDLPGLATSVTAFAGAYHGWGFHEDGCRSGADAARALGVTW